jgi:HSP20 family protein
METADEKFFEGLAGDRKETDEEYKIELAKTGSASVARKSRAAAAEDDDEDEDEKPAASNEPEGQLTIDVYQTPSDIVVESAIAGVKPEDIDIHVTNDSITVRGERHREKEAGDVDYFYQECYWGRFSRSVILPQEVDPESASVTFKNGILKVRLPKLNRKKTRKLRVRIE